MILEGLSAFRAFSYKSRIGLKPGNLRLDGIMLMHYGRIDIGLCVFNWHLIIILFISSLVPPHPAPQKNMHWLRQRRRQQLYTIENKNVTWKPLNIKTKPVIFSALPFYSHVAQFCKKKRKKRKGKAES